MGGQPRVVVIAYPAQGHVGPLMKLTCRIADHGIRVTFAIAESCHARVLEVLGRQGVYLPESVEMVSIPDAIQQLTDKTDRESMAEAMSSVLPRNFEYSLRQINQREDEKVTCVIADATFSWALEVADKLGIRRAMFWPTLVRGFALTLSIPQLVEAGFVDNRGSACKQGMIQFSEELPAISTSELMWTCPGDPNRQEKIFRYASGVSSTVKISDWLLCNSFYELDPTACDIIPGLLPIGPLLHCSNSNTGNNPGNFWLEDETCVDWLDKQPIDSVIYIAFGSIAVVNQEQFQELAIGLELSGRPFLWVVRFDFLEGKTGCLEYPDGFLDRVAYRGKMVSWAPQEKVLSHPSVTCFITHCGWNSTVEGLSYGTRFLCWPYFADQFYIRTYICDVLEVGLRLQVEEASGIVSRHEIVQKLRILICDVQLKKNVEKIKAMAGKSISEDGLSNRNFRYFVEQLKSC